MSNIPQDTIDSIDRYVNDRIPTGGFLYAVMTNDLKEAVGRADSRNIDALADIVKHLVWNVPGNCWGSPEAVAAWLNREEDA